MAFTKEFVVDLVKTHDNYYGWPNLVQFVQAHWKITHSSYPDGEAVHYFVKELNVDEVTEETYLAIDEVTDSVLEQWVTADLTADEVTAVENHSISIIRSSHFRSSLTTHYQNPDSLVVPLI